VLIIWNLGKRQRKTLDIYLLNISYVSAVMRGDAPVIRSKFKNHLSIIPY